jgi:hypothetical protein
MSAMVAERGESRRSVLASTWGFVKHHVLTVY